MLLLGSKLAWCLQAAGHFPRIGTDDQPSAASRALGEIINQSPASSQRKNQPSTAHLWQDPQHAGKGFLCSPSSLQAAMSLWHLQHETRRFASQVDT